MNYPGDRADLTHSYGHNSFRCHEEQKRARNAHLKRARTIPKPEVIAAVEFLLTQPDAHLYRRRYLELLTHTTTSDGTDTDYTNAENYVLTAAARRRPARPPARP